MKTKLMILAMLVALLFGGVVLPADVAFAQKADAAGVAIPIKFSSAAGSFAGTFTLTKFAVQNGHLVGIGTLTGKVKNALGQVVGTVNRALTLPVAAISGTCQILHLELGPLDLTLLGLHVHLNKVVLNITAQQGGGLLGDLLCSIANLLHNHASLNALV